jgi:ribosomal protein S20
MGGAVSGAIAAINKDDAPEAIRLLRFAQDVIMEALIAKRGTIIDATAERIRVKLGSDNWEQAEHQ